MGGRGENFSIGGCRIGTYSRLKDGRVVWPAGSVMLEAPAAPLAPTQTPRTFRFSGTNGGQSQDGRAAPISGSLKRGLCVSDGGNSLTACHSFQRLPVCECYHAHHAYRVKFSADGIQLPHGVASILP